MVANAVVSEVQRGVGSFDGFRHLKPIDNDNTTPQRLGWLWEQLSKNCDYAFTDFTRGKIDYFLEQFTSEGVEFFELEDAGLVMIENPTPAGSAFIHYVVWDRAGYTTQQQRNSAREMFDYLFYNKRVHHVAGLIPSFNQHAVRLASSMGMKYEGEIRENFLYRGKYFNHLIYGLLESEYRVRRGRL